MCPTVKEQLYALFDALAHEQGSVVYAGAFPDDHTPRMIEVSEHMLSDENGCGRELRSRATFTLIEAYQNLVRHRARTTPGNASILLIHGEGHTDVMTMNEVLNEDVDALRKALCRTEGMGTEALKRMYLETLTSGTTGTRGGAGLGLIEMARRSGHPLRHHFSPSSGSSHRFHLVVNCGARSDTSGPSWLAHLDLSLKAVGLLAGAGGRRWSAGTEHGVLRMIEAEPGIPGPELARACHACITVLHHLKSPGGGGLVLCRRDGRSWCIDMLVSTEAGVGEKVVELAPKLNASSLTERRNAYHRSLLGRSAAQEPWRTKLQELALRVRTMDATLRMLPERGPVLLVEGRI
jgi:hypothetical protein